MIVKSFKLNDLKKTNSNFFLFYGENEGQKDEVIQDCFTNGFTGEIIKYDENQILDNQEVFFETCLNDSLFDNDKIIQVNRVTSKLYEIIKKIVEKEIHNKKIIFKSDKLDKKSKLRNLFEKNKELICIAFYPDTFQNLNSIALNFFKKRNIRISNQSINLIIERANNKRQNLNNELEKINNYLNGKKEINFEEVLKLTNLSGEYDISILIDSCLAKNENQLIKIINENNFSNDDSVMILRYLLNKSKRLLKIKDHIEQNNDNVEIGIASFKPPIFWKEKDTIKKQIKNWTKKSIIELIDEINKTELIVKKNFSFSINILLDFIFDKTKLTSS